MQFSNPQKNITQLGIQEGSTIVDLGAGAGAYTIPAAQMIGGSGKVHAVEVRKDMLPKIKSDAQAQHLTNIEVIWGDIERRGGTKLARGIADVVLLCNVLFAVEDQRGTVSETKRILKSGGRVLVVDWTDSHGGLGPHPNMIVSKRQARELFERAGFSIIKEINAGAHHWGFVAKKV